MTLPIWFLLIWACLAGTGVVAIIHTARQRWTTRTRTLPDPGDDGWRMYGSSAIHPSGLKIEKHGDHNCRLLAGDMELMNDANWYLRRVTLGIAARNGVQRVLRALDPESPETEQVVRIKEVSEKHIMIDGKTQWGRLVVEDPATWKVGDHARITVARVSDFDGND